MPCKSQSTVEFMILASFMLLVILGFFAVTSSILLDAREEAKRKIAEDIADFAYREVEVAKAVNEGYARLFLMPQRVNDIDYSVTVTDNVEMSVNYLGYEFIKFLPSNVTGNVSRGVNLIYKKEGIIYITNSTMLISKYFPQSPEPLICTIVANCSDTILFRISALSNAHAEMPDNSNYPYAVCCRRNGDSLGTSCSSGFTFLRLSAETNAHVQKNSYFEYPFPVCLSSNYNVLCDYTADSCASMGYTACIATISSDTNAHVADCVTDPYPLKVCCR